MLCTIDKLALNDWKSSYVGKGTGTEYWDHNNNYSFPISMEIEKRKLDTIFIEELPISYWYQKAIMFGKEITYSCMARLAGADGMWTNLPTTDLSGAQNIKCKGFYGQSFTSCQVIHRFWKHLIQLGIQKGLK